MDKREIIIFFLTANFLFSQVMQTNHSNCYPRVKHIYEDWTLAFIYLSEIISYLWKIFSSSYTIVPYFHALPLLCN